MFEEKFVRQRRPVKIVGCFEQSNKLSEFSTQQLLENLKTSGTFFKARILDGEHTVRERNIDKVELNLGKGSLFDLEVLSLLSF